MPTDRRIPSSTDPWGPGPRRADPLRVAHIVLSLDLGGLERVVLDLTREGINLGQRVAIICLLHPGRLAPQAEALGVRVACVYKRAGIRFGTIPRLRKVLRTIDPDIIHTHQLGALFYTGPATWRPIVHTEHGKSGDDSQRQLWLKRLAACYATRFFGVSGDIAAEAVSRGIVPRRKVGVLPNGIDPGQFDDRGGRDAVRRAFGIPVDAPVIGTVGRLSEIKQQDLLIRAFDQAQTTAPDAHLLIVGDGPRKDELRRLVVEHGLAGRVHFAGYQPQPERYLAAMDVFALTSRSEGMPLAVLEAWAARLPVIATRVGGLPEMIDDGRTGLLVDAGDLPALTEALESLISDPGRSRRIGEAGRDRVGTTFNLRRMAAEYDRHYRELLKRRRALRPPGASARGPASLTLWMRSVN